MSYEYEAMKSVRDLLTVVSLVCVINAFALLAANVTGRSSRRVSVAFAVFFAVAACAAFYGSYRANLNLKDLW